MALSEDFVYAEIMKVRRVRTAAGSKKFGVPIGAPIPAAGAVPKRGKLQFGNAGPSPRRKEPASAVVARINESAKPKGGRMGSKPKSGGQKRKRPASEIVREINQSSPPRKRVKRVSQLVSEAEARKLIPEQEKKGASVWEPDPVKVKRRTRTDAHKATLKSLERLDELVTNESRKDTNKNAALGRVLDRQKWRLDPRNRYPRHKASAAKKRRMNKKLREAGIRPAPRSRNVKREPGVEPYLNERMRTPAEVIVPKRKRLELARLQREARERAARRRSLGRQF